MGSPSLHSLAFQGPAVTANHALRAAGVKAEARRGRATRGAWTLASTGLHSTAAGPPLNSRKRCIHFGEEPVYIGPEHLKRDYHGWGFAPDTTWVNLQTIALHHFKTLVAKNGFVARNCDAPQPSRMVQFFMPTVHANEPGCDGLHWLDGTIVRGCCDDHDRCYAKDGCTQQSWWRFWSSWTCDFCNAAVVSCFVGGGNPDPRCITRLVC